MENEEDPFLRDLSNKHFAEIKCSVNLVSTKIGGQRMTDYLDFFMKPFVRLYWCIGELIEYKIQVAISKEKQKIIDITDKERFNENIR